MCPDRSHFLYDSNSTCDAGLCHFIIIIIIIIIDLLKSTEQEDAHMINTRTRAGQERHEKLALKFCPLKKQKKNKHTRYKKNCDYAYRKNAEKSTRLSDCLNLDNDEKSTA